MNTLLNTIPRLAKIFSNKSLIRRVLMLVQLYYFYLSRKILNIRKEYRLSIAYQGKIFNFYLLLPMDLAVMKEIYIDDEYKWFPIENPKVIIDLGAHIGDTALYYHAHFPDALILAVEPSPENYERLVRNTSNINNIKPIHAAIGSSDGEIELNVMPSSLGHSIVKRGDTLRSVRVPLVSLRSLFDQYNIKNADLIKFDIEGAEFDLLSNISPEEYAQAYIGELHYDLVDFAEEALLTKFDLFNTELKKIRSERFILKSILK